MSATAKFTPPMSERAHTKGPWATREYGDGDSLVIEAGADWRICFMATPGSSPNAMQRIEANARLIAAAPDMFEALKKAREFIANGIELGFIRMPDASTNDPAHDTLPAIEAALSRASGEAV